MPSARSCIDCMEDEGLNFGAELPGREVIHSTLGRAAVEGTVEEFEKNGFHIRATALMRRASFGPCAIEFWLDHNLGKCYAIGDHLAVQRELNQALVNAGGVAHEKQSSIDVRHIDNRLIDAIRAIAERHS